ncbi:MAG: Isocitrate dehydrogenase (NADP) [Chloroflexi bacterium ADurb.Bin325]|nr:MAG: Isocitrate dehydrogenase (NADP) [Chloroflexi bacterium ADurb.Bin325]
MNIVIIRENEEDLYAGIEHRQTDEVVQVLKIVSRPGSEAIIRYAFEYARAYGRRKVTCMTKDNIMKLGDGLFHRVFDEVAAEYPDIQHEHQIIDIGAARLAAQPEMLDVVVTLNLYGDILSDIAAQVAGSIGLAGSANIGYAAAMFEAVHGSAPDIAGMDIANPSGLLQAATQMLVHIGQPAVAERITNAWLCTLEDGIHTGDTYRMGLSQERVGTRAFTDAIIARLGRQPSQGEPALYRGQGVRFKLTQHARAVKKLVGVDVFLHWDEPGRDAEALARQLAAAYPGPLRLSMITNRGVKVYPEGLPETFHSDHWRCRFIGSSDALPYAEVLALLTRLTEAGLDVIKTENLYTFDGEPGYSLGQGE